MCSVKSAAEDHRVSEENVGRALEIRKWCRLTLGVSSHLTQRVPCGHTGLKKQRVQVVGGPGRGAGTAQTHFWRGRHMEPETFIPGRSVGGAGGLMLVRS